MIYAPSKRLISTLVRNRYRVLARAFFVSIFCLCSLSIANAGGRTVLHTDYDDARVGRESAQGVASQIGIMPDEERHAYINAIGQKLLRGVARRGYDYQFAVVDQTEPNAFALPGGYIFISRGLLALAGNEDELACVIGHEITHAAHRHAAAAQQMEQRAIGIGYGRMANSAAYSRNMERDADKGGQELCAAAGYDPMGMSTFLQHLSHSVRLQYGYEPGPSFFDSHPGSTERVAINAVRAREMRWTRDPKIGDPQASLYKQIDGLPVGQRPESGMFKGNQFFHPDMNFTVKFPRGWRTANSTQAVGATEPHGEAVVFLRADMPDGNPQERADEWVHKENKDGNMKIKESKPVKVGHIDAWRVKLEARGRGASTSAYVTFFPYGGVTWSMTGMTSTLQERSFLGRTLVAARSFRPLTLEERNSLSGTSLNIVKAQEGEGFEALSDRTKNAWGGQETAVFNGVMVTHKYNDGDLVKIAVRKTYAPSE